ncbi:phytoene desaturase family protein [Corynebacterium pygosceleis]|uniref:Phytoene desaturase family protein n=1 Tax=Corynebacterium pygosceleis TaxID=2800406 RepID=A0A9Q4C8A2_9CORY|nr:phytoene desaturase family protein [Corynebacterium pygosceleis]MCK7637242.1 phytoene desaturase family protein [Corynebacterium pygosceleis]MCK7676179.1 phytoene desaturase family protein [Corynebacterium pygosceleis]MCL0119983.1 phytoene desaturase family protein [Corynebacterium pygosceleis]MCX7445145.1 phytoene desaturase family protein [Corynebacterium pygosceleis]MCX7468430.1 phytoene desaturase family protein [Corynebacterium pygosceleis]
MKAPGSPRRAVVIGAGVAGLASAALLAREGLDVTVYETNPTTGGRAGSLTVESAPGFRWDTGPSWYLMPDAFDHFFRLMGTTTEAELDLVTLDPAYRIYPEGSAPLDVPAGRENTIEMFERIEPGAGGALRTYLDSAADAYRIAVDRFLYTTFSGLRGFTDPDVRTRLGLLGTLLTTPLDAFAARHVRDVRLRQILTYPSVFLASRPGNTPALYHLMSHTDLTQGVRYPRGGFAAVVDAVERVARRSGVDIVTGTRVTGISTGTVTGRPGPAILGRFRRPVSRATGVRVRRPDGHIERVAADLVVSCADLHHTENALLPAELRSYPEKWWGNRNPGPGTVLLMLGVRGELPELAHHTLLFSRDWDTDFDTVFDGAPSVDGLPASRSIYISKPSATDPDVAPEGHENLFVLVPVPADPRIGHGDAYRSHATGLVDDIAEATIRRISERTGIPDLAERVVVRRTLGPADFSERYNSWRGNALGPAHTLRQSAFLRGSNASALVGGLYYAGATTLPGVGVPMCLISAENVIKRVRGDRSPGPLRE